jgi:opacity protein-like surface antigen
MRTNRTLVFRLLLWVALLMCSTAVALAQSAQTDEYPKIEVFAGYSALGEVNGRGISFGTASINANYAGKAGFETSLIRNFSKHIGIKGDFSAHFDNSSGSGLITSCTPTCTSATQDIQLKTRVFNFLAGAAHTSARFTTPGPTLNFVLKRSDTSFAMALGGGLDIRATKRVSFRGSLDYNPVFIKDSTSGTHDLVRFSLGVLFH